MEVLQELLRATSSEEVTEIIENHQFFQDVEWRDYGDLENNLGTIKGQSPYPVGALVEKITNGIDAVIFAKVQAEGIDPASDQAPQSQRQAIKKYFGKDVLDFNLTNEQKRELASQTLQITAEGTRTDLTLGIRDYGEGQIPSRFPETFVSLNKSTKIKSHFAHGIYNQGGSAVLNFCKNGYQLILSRRHPDLKSNALYGWTLVRLFQEEGHRQGRYQYCTINGSVPFFDGSETITLPTGEDFDYGSYIRLYSYQYPHSASNITFNAAGALSRDIDASYLKMPLPIELVELREDVGVSIKNRVRRQFGLWRLIEQADYLKKRFTLRADLGVFGNREIEVALIDYESEAGRSYVEKHGNRLFLTVNGQVQHAERAQFISRECKLPDLADYMLIHIDLSNAGVEASSMFGTNRISMIETPEFLHFRQRLKSSIGDDETLQEFNREYRNYKMTTDTRTNQELSKKIAKLIEQNPEMRSFFLPGSEIVIREQGDKKAKPFVGSNIPTFLTLDKNHIEIQEGKRATIVFKTDMQNDYLNRTIDGGDFNWPPSEVFEINHHAPWNGKIRVDITPTPGTVVGDKDTLSFVLTRPGQSPLSAGLSVEIVEPLEIPAIDHKTHKPKQDKGLMMPKSVGVPKADWHKHKWDEHSIAEVDESADGVVVYYNEEPKVLHNFINSQQESVSSTKLNRIKNKFYTAIQLYSLSFFVDAREDEENRGERLEQLPDNMKSVARVLLDLSFNRDLD